MSTNASNASLVRLQVALESAPSGLVMTDSEGRIIVVNREVERMFAYSRDELLGQPVDLLLPDALRAAHPAHRKAFLASARPRPMGAGRDLHGRRKDGSEVPIEIGLTPVETEEGVFVLAAVVDISARKAAEAQANRHEQQLLQSQKLEALGTLATGIAHDFNNLLAAIVGYAGLVEQQLPNDSPARNDVAEIQRAAERGRELVRRIMAVGRRADPVRVPLPLGDVVGEAAALLRSTLPQGVVLRLLVETPSPRIAGDATSLQQVVLNLATNAVHAMPAGGRLELQVERRYLRSEELPSSPGQREGWYAQLTVSDQGAGMPAEVARRALEPFFTTKGPGEGTGLGLSIVNTLVQEHGGFVLLESTPGAGTSVRCLFPALETVTLPASSTPPARPTQPERGIDGEEVLLVDDDEAVLAAWSRILTSVGYEVTAFGDPRAALAKFRENPARFVLLVTDQRMPGMTGLELATALRALRADLPVLLVSGTLDGRAVAPLPGTGPMRTLQKPVSVSDLATAVRRVVGARPPG